jgi:hypothetical protein
MRERYLFDDSTVVGLDNFPRFQGTLRALCFADDPCATRPAVELLCSGFKSIRPEILTIAPGLICTDPKGSGKGSGKGSRGT